MTRWIASLVMAAALWSQMAAPSQAQNVCGDRSEILDKLESQHAETRQAIGLSEDGALLEVMVSPNGSWTLLLTYPERPTCVVAVGRDWATLALVGDPA